MKFFGLLLIFSFYLSFNWVNGKKTYIIETDEGDNNGADYTLDTPSSGEDKKWDGKDKKWEGKDKKWDGKDKKWEGKDKKWDGKDKKWEGKDKKWEGKDWKSKKGSEDRK